MPYLTKKLSTCTTVVKKLMDEFFICFSLLEQLHSDQGRNFKSDVTVEVCRLLATAKMRATLYYPQSDGLVKRLNHTFLTMLATVTYE